MGLPLESSCGLAYTKRELLPKRWHHLFLPALGTDLARLDVDGATHSPATDEARDVTRQHEPLCGRELVPIDLVLLQEMSQPLFGSLLFSLLALPNAASLSVNGG